MNSNQCKHGFYVDSKGNHILPKERSTAELIAEAQKIIDRKEPEIVPKPQPQAKPVNEIKKLSRLLEDY